MYCKQCGKEIHEDDGRLCATCERSAADKLGHITQGAWLICEEHRRQVETEYFGDAHDDEHTNYELSRAACCYAQMGRGGPYSHPDPKNPPHDWPWDAFWKPSADPVTNLVKAGALIAAEIDRIMRMRALKIKEFN
jgi:hypothetical protein